MSESPLEDAEGGRSAGQAGAGSRGDAQANQQASVVVRAVAVAGESPRRRRRPRGPGRIRARPDARAGGRRTGAARPPAAGPTTGRCAAGGPVRGSAPCPVRRRASIARWSAGSSSTGSPRTDQLRRIDRRRQAQMRRAAQAMRFGRELQGVQQGPVLAGARLAQQTSRGQVAAQGARDHEAQAQQPQPCECAGPRPSPLCGRHFVRRCACR